MFTCLRIFFEEKTYHDASPNGGKCLKGVCHNDCCSVVEWHLKWIGFFQGNLFVIGQIAKFLVRQKIAMIYSCRFGDLVSTSYYILA
jgi:hypothetical protein